MGRGSNGIFPRTGYEKMVTCSSEMERELQTVDTVWSEVGVIGRQF